jgi:tRNA threonylcarbamoyl adenosine modification protein YeaZ
MPFNLLIDTTRETLMLALAHKEGILSQHREENSSHRYHSSILLPRIQTLLTAQGITAQDLNGIAVNCGPGSFTGIRTGLTAAKLLGQFLPVKLYGFNSFELIAGSSPYRGEAVTVLLNAFREQHYHATLKVDETGEITWISEPTVNPNSTMLNINTPHCLFEASLSGKLILEHSNPQVLEESLLFTPAVMAFYLQHQPNRPSCSWGELNPVYLQQPHVSQPKAVPVQ